MSDDENPAPQRWLLGFSSRSLGFWWYRLTKSRKSRKSRHRKNRKFHRKSQKKMFLKCFYDPPAPLSCLQHLGTVFFSMFSLLRFSLPKFSHQDLENWHLKNRKNFIYEINWKWMENRKKSKNMIKKNRCFSIQSKFRIFRFFIFDQKNRKFSANFFFTSNFFGFSFFFLMNKSFGKISFRTFQKA